MRRTLTTACIVSLSAALGCSSPASINHGPGGSGGNGGGVGSGGGGTGGNGGGGSGGSGGSGGGGGNMPDGGVNCGVQNFMLTKSGTPDLLIVQDRSGSMAEDADGNMPPATGMPTKWDAITMAIEQVVTSVTTVDWGLMFFGPDSGGGFGGGGCNVSSTPQVPCGMNNAMNITSAIMATSPTTSTPTAEAMTAATTYFKGNTDGNSHYILLATDGQPSCGLGDETGMAETAVTTAAMAGIKTIVVGIGNDPTADTTLSTMATNGGMPNMTAGQKPYYQVNTTADLVKVLNTIAGTIISCDYALQSVPANPNLVTIKDSMGNTIPRDPTHMNGWDFGPGNMSIQFYGNACTNLQKGVTTGLAAVYGCPPIM